MVFATARVNTFLMRQGHSIGISSLCAPLFMLCAVLFVFIHFYSYQIFIDFTLVSQYDAVTKWSDPHLTPAITDIYEGSLGPYRLGRGSVQKGSVYPEFYRRGDVHEARSNPKMCRQSSLARRRDGNEVQTIYVDT